MPKVPALTGRQVVKALKRIGFVEDRHRGSHVMMYHPIHGGRAVVPVHAGKTIKKSLLLSIVEKDAGMTLEEFLTKC
ncbi:MAG: hypothetical protein A3I39_00800 [Candidatus Yanofskybacteria bacterium RIFCSPLOWO2_02_FULL_47_9b]|uniref:Toxin HicA n=1 Tax=Candidatus Yanofskybacteria bacterium RIFCSPLOWO2_02_FULL_47_9b TaxID=1802708 RepID=A0A1F8H625_9BACT|nr:MAG: hypothetical protein A3I39_00800 [Candidatus Yanofskybacteria bacterium RIFCSPLOWO2_02_FULL_47_9b]